MNINRNGLGVLAAATVMTLATPLAAVAQTDPADASPSAMDQTTMPQEMQDGAASRSTSLLEGAQTVADIGGVNADHISIVSVGSQPRMAMDGSTGDAVRAALAVNVAPGSSQAYSNAPSPGTLGRMLQLAGYDPAQVVGMQAADDGGVTVFVTDGGS